MVTKGTTTMNIYRLSIYRMVPNGHGYEVFTKDFKKYESAHLSGVVFAKAVANREVGLDKDDRYLPEEPKSYDADEFSVKVKIPEAGKDFVAYAYKVRVEPVDIATEALCTEDFKKLGVA